jgi:hypothetical protein
MALSQAPKGDAQGDAGATKLGAAVTTCTPPSPRSPLPESQAVRGSRFWALTDESSDDEDLPEVDFVAAKVLRSPRSGPSAVTLGDFLSPVWQQVRSGKSSAAVRQRERFAPGGWGSWLRRAPAAQRPGSRSSSSQGGVEAFGARVVLPTDGGAVTPACSSAQGTPQAQWPAGCAAAPLPERVDIVEESTVGASVAPSCQEQVSVVSSPLADSGPSPPSPLPPPAQASEPASQAGPCLGAQIPEGFQF